jgi:hypothetical protein
LQARPIEARGDDIARRKMPGPLLPKVWNKPASFLFPARHGAPIAHGEMGLSILAPAAHGLEGKAFLNARGRGAGRDGVSVLSFENEKNVARRGKSEQASQPRSSKDKSKKKGGSTAEVGSALRSIYQRTVSEDIPPDLLDLLGKLG